MGPTANTAAFFLRLEEVGRFVEERGRLPRYRGSDDTERRLANWLGKQQTASRAGRLTSQRRQALESAGWLQGLQETAWAEHFAALARFVAEHGQLPPASHNSLYRWLCTARTSPHADIDALDALLSKFPMRNRPGWWDRLESVDRFHAEHGRYPRRYSDLPGELTLGRWVLRQREHARRGTLAEDKCEAMAARGLLGPGRTDVSHWERRFNDLVAWCEEHGRAPPYQHDDKREKSLNIWINKQRYGPGRARNDLIRRERLESLLARHGYERAKDGWKKRLGEFEAWCKAHGRFPRPEGDESEKRLWRWSDRASRSATSECKEALGALFCRYGSAGTHGREEVA